MSHSLETLLTEIEVSSVLEASISKDNYVAIDLSTTNQELKDIDVSSSETLGLYINRHIKKSDATVAYGGYIETRNIYNRSTYFNSEQKDTERNIHLGTDLWLPVDAPIFSPIDGVVHSFQNNRNHGDYGPTIILEHHIENSRFYTLYGHLSLDALKTIKVGETIKRGSKIATLGPPLFNGDYPPHLHFQIIKDLGNHKGDYPGVCSIRDLEFYKGNCLDPNLILRL
ncbi:peptidoglycan DD-metalloendopeptidase family protein [Sediminibacter sp. Hel_I_10]|uniref:peptidoglycan DD-metalloendopeptidase family protein n=1 Tax=Sediminibacter sp. Hel_I_10 TaxID=1392490 RepID=UPI00047CE7E3|nr:peptidoglycan DD-metalloendopeptidase family protein [Sediminibacter sp. Hel_I_10]